MTEPNDDLPSLAALQQRIDEVRGTEVEPQPSSSGRDLSQAVRLCIDLVAGVAVGVGFGYVMDNWLHTVPLCMIVGLFIGMAAGVRNMMRSADVIDKTNEQEDKS